MNAINDGWICKQNINRFQARLLSMTEGEGERKILTRLLEQERARLAELSSTRKADRGAPMDCRSSQSTSNADEVCNS